MKKRSCSSSPTSSNDARSAIVLLASASSESEAPSAASARSSSDRRGSTRPRRLAPVTSMLIAVVELPGHLLVRLERCRREVPRIPVDLTRIHERLCERAMDRAPLGVPRGSIDRRADKRMPEADLRRLHADEPGLLCALEC